MQHEQDITFALHDRSHCLAPGLFRSLRKGERRKLKLDVRYEFGDGTSIRFIGFEPLGAVDLRVLQGLVALTGPHGLLLNSEPETIQGRELRRLLKIEQDGKAAGDQALMAYTSQRRLLSAIGMDVGGKNLRILKSSLIRMSNVTLLVSRGRTEASYGLLSFAIDECNGHLYIALNPRLTNAILGNAGHARIELAEVRQLKTDPARLMHQRLCGWVDPGETRRASITTLSSYVWPNSTDDANTAKKRRKTIRHALDDLRAAGWGAKEDAGMVILRRPKARS